MNRTLKVMSVVTIFLVALSVVAGLFMGYTMQACSGCGTLGALVLMIVAVPTLICAMVTAGVWMFQRNHSVREGSSILEPNPDKTLFHDR